MPPQPSSPLLLSPNSRPLSHHLLLLLSPPPLSLSLPLSPPSPPLFFSSSSLLPCSPSCRRSPCTLRARVCPAISLLYLPILSP
eukprot:2139158-Rhodomonas_salina.3